MTLSIDAKQKISAGNPSHHRPEPTALGSSLSDPQGRAIGYLRLSLTPACQMRCSYCRPTVIHNRASEPTMSPETIERLVRHLAGRWGLSKVRLTGGEPTIRPDLEEIIERVSRVEGIDDLAMTTNGLSLPTKAGAYRRAGLRRVNVSLDSLKPAMFRQMTGVKGPGRVIDGIHAAMEAGLGPIRLNCVVLAGENDAELPYLVRFAAARGLTIRFIELMPMGPLADRWADRYVDAEAMRARIDPIVTRWERLDQGHDSATPYRVTLDDGRVTTVGFITPMSCNFCAACNRLRITAAGDVYPCLMDEPRGNIADALTPTFDPDRLDAALRNSLSQKAAEHPVEGFTQMTILGG